ncbi:MAG TPA: hypothetical protein VF831_09945 [Anaerolineales bacterium]
MGGNRLDVSGNSSARGGVKPGDRQHYGRGPSHVVTLHQPSAVSHQLSAMQSRELAADISSLWVYSSAIMFRCI